MTTHGISKSPDNLRKPLNLPSSSISIFILLIIRSPCNLIHFLCVFWLLQEVPMLPQPSYAQSGSIYYICLLRDELLLHQGMETNNHNLKDTSKDTDLSTCGVLDLIVLV